MKKQTIRGDKDTMKINSDFANQDRIKMQNQKFFQF